MILDFYNRQIEKPKRSKGLTQPVPAPLDII